MVETEDTGRQKATKGASHGSHDDVERQAEGKLGAAVPAGQVVRNTRHHARLEDTEQEADTGGLVEVVHEGGAKRDDAEAERDSRDEPTGTNPLAHDVGRNLEQDV